MNKSGNEKVQVAARQPRHPGQYHKGYTVNSLRQEESFLNAMRENPNDLSLRLVFADWLEEQGDSRGELLRLTHALTQAIEVPNRSSLEDRLRALLEEDVQPIGPFWTNSLGMKFAWVPAGTFLMGSPLDEEGRIDEEIQHRVTLTSGFYMGVHLVTQEQWQAVMGNNPSHFKGEKNLPVEQVSWDDSQGFIEKLREQDRKPYQLPTEAQWEYACRGGTTTPFHFGATISTDQANYFGEIVYGDGKRGVYREKTTPIGRFSPNVFGLFDMHGNVLEWCQEIYGEYPQDDVVAPQGPASGPYRVLRGGSWYNGPIDCRSACRDCTKPGYRDSGCGLRVCFSPE